MGCTAPISQLRKGQKPQVRVAMASLMAATAELRHLSRTIPGRRCSWKLACAGRCRSCRGWDSMWQARGPPAWRPPAWRPLAWHLPRGQWLLTLLRPWAAGCVLLWVGALAPWRSICMPGELPLGFSSAPSGQALGRGARHALHPSSWHLLIDFSSWVKSPSQGPSLCPQRSVCVSTALCPWSCLTWGTCLSDS